MKKIHPEVPSAEKYQCEICGIKFVNKISYNEHIFRHRIQLSNMNFH